MGRGIIFSVTKIIKKIGIIYQGSQDFEVQRNHLNKLLNKPLILITDLIWSSLDHDTQPLSHEASSTYKKDKISHIRLPQIANIRSGTYSLSIDAASIGFNQPMELEVRLTMENLHRYLGEYRFFQHH